MLHSDMTPEHLCEDLLGRKLEDVDPEERRVLERIASGTITGNDAHEEAALHASFGDRLADRVAAVGGSWGFIIAFGVILVSWMLINSRLLEVLGLHPFDGYPYIFLNLILSMLAAIQAPVIMMSQNRQAARDRFDAQQDYQVNVRAEMQISELHVKLDEARNVDWQAVIALQRQQLEVLERIERSVKAKD